MICRALIMGGGEIYDISMGLRAPVACTSSTQNGMQSIVTGGVRLHNPGSSCFAFTGGP